MLICLYHSTTERALNFNTAISYCRVVHHAITSDSGHIIHVTHNSLKFAILLQLSLYIQLDVPIEYAINLSKVFHWRKRIFSNKLFHNNQERTDTYIKWNAKIKTNQRFCAQRDTSALTSHTEWGCWCRFRGENTRNMKLKYLLMVNSLKNL